VLAVTRWFIVHSNVDGATVLFDGDIKGQTSQGLLYVEAYTTGTPYLTFRVEKRYSYGLVLNTFYTHSKALNNSDSDGAATGITFYNRSLEKAVAGSDLVESETTLRLQRLGAKIFIGHRAENVEEAMCVISSAVKKDNPEVMAAQERI
jgi:hypothetical protein